MYSTSVPPYGPPSGATQSNRIVLYVVVGLLVGCLCCALVAGAVALLGGVGIFGAASGLVSEAQSLHTTVDGYLRAMSEKDADTAYTYFAAGSRVSLSQLKEQFSGRAFAQYDQYESSSVNKYHVNADEKGTLATISGSIRYRDGSTGSFDATLRKEGDVWKLTEMPAITLGK